MRLVLLLLLPLCRATVEDRVSSILARAHAAAASDAPAESPIVLFATAARLQPAEPSHFSNLGTAILGQANNEPATHVAVQLYLHAERAYRRAASLWRRGRKNAQLPDLARKSIRTIKKDVSALRQNCRFRFDENCKDMPEAAPSFRQRSPLADGGTLAVVAEVLGTHTKFRSNKAETVSTTAAAPPPKSSRAQKKFLKDQYGTGSGRVLTLDDSEDVLHADPTARVGWHFRHDDFDVPSSTAAWPGGSFAPTKRALARLKRVMVAVGYYQDNVLSVLDESVFQGYSPERTSKQGIGSGMRARDQLLARIEAYESLDVGGSRHQRAVLAYLVRLFFAGLTVDARLLRDAIGDDAMAMLLLDGGGLGVLERHPLDQIHERGKRRRRGKKKNKKNRRRQSEKNTTGGGAAVTDGDAYAISSRVQITPVRDDLHVMTDWHQTQSRSSVEPVMYIGADSRGLVWAQPPIPTPQVLDLCTGSGVQGIVAARYYADRVVLVDFNPRAVRFARMNLVLNGLEDKATVLLGDLYGALDTNAPPEGWGGGGDAGPAAGAASAAGSAGAAAWGKFGAILANPPFLPIAEGSIGQNAYGDGGPDGERVFRRIVEEAPLHLTEQGRVHITSNLLDPHIFDQKLWRWWSKHLKDNWEVDRVTGHRERYMRAPTGQVAAFHMIRSEIWTQADYGDVVEDRGMGDALKIAGIEYATKGFIFIYANRATERAHQHSSYTVHNDHHSIWNVVSANQSAAHALQEKYHNLDGYFDGAAYPFGSGYPYRYFVGEAGVEKEGAQGKQMEGGTGAGSTGQEL